MDIGSVSTIDINQEMRSSYLDYAMSVIVARALPDARDGLKPVHRRILYAMNSMGIRPNTPHRKSARIVGEVLGKYHPHSDTAVYDSMVRMAQDFSMRYPLIDGQGNFGSIDGDGAAAMRYTEARLATISMELLQDIDQETVDFQDNFDGSESEPIVLPARLPNLLLNGSSGIAVGMATNAPPHNLTEICNALTYVIDHFNNLDDVTLDDLMQFVTGPDFPTAGLIVGMEGIRSAYATGRGRVIMRARAEIEELPGTVSGRQRINVTEIPFQVNKSTLIERIAELARKDVLTDISDLRDESDKDGISIIIELKRGAQPMKVLNQLYKHTTLQSTFGVQMLALVDKEPRLLSLKRALQIYVDHRIEIITRRTQYELKKARRRQHILVGLLKAIEFLDAVIETIRSSPDADYAKEQLMTTYQLSDEQAVAILDMQLRRLAALEQKKLEEEYKEITAHIEYLETLLADRQLILDLIREDVIYLKDKYGDERRTQIVLGDSELRMEDIVPDEDVLISISQRGYIKRTPVSAYRKQARGGKGLIGAGTKDEDELEQLFAAGSHNTILFFSNQGKVYAEKAYQVPEYDRTARGTSLMNILPLQSEERITAVLPVRDFEDGEYLTMITRNARIKRTELSAFANVRSTGLIALGLEDDDELGWVKMTHDKQDLILISEQGKGIRFSEEDVRPMGRTARGVMAMALAKGDALAGADAVEPGADLLIITERGHGKRTPLSDYRCQNRYGQGVIAMELQNGRGNIVAARVVQDGDEVTCISANGIILRTGVDTISRQGRITQGVRVMDLRNGDVVASVAVIREGRLSQSVEDDEAVETAENGEMIDYGDENVEGAAVNAENLASGGAQEPRSASNGQGPAADA